MPHVLVIDDDRSICEMVRLALEKADLTTATAMTAAEGLKMLQADRPEMVLLDIMLPEASGLDVFKQIQEIDRKLPIVFITSGTDSSTAIKAMQLGGFD